MHHAHHYCCQTCQIRSFGIRFHLLWSVVKPAFTAHTNLFNSGKHKLDDCYLDESFFEVLLVSFHIMFEVFQSVESDYNLQCRNRVSQTAMASYLLYLVVQLVLAKISFNSSKSFNHFQLFQTLGRTICHWNSTNNVWWITLPMMMLSIASASSVNKCDPSKICT